MNMRRAQDTEDIISFIVQQADEWQQKELLSGSLVSKTWHWPFLRALWRSHGSLMVLLGTMGMKWSKDALWRPIERDFRWSQDLYTRYAPLATRFSNTHRSKLVSTSQLKALIEKHGLSDAVRGVAIKNLEFQVIEENGDRYREACSIINTSTITCFTIQCSPLNAAEILDHARTSFPNLKDLTFQVFMHLERDADVQLVGALANAVSSMMALERVALSGSLYCCSVLEALSTLPYLKVLQITSRCADTTSVQTLFCLQEFATASATRRIDFGQVVFPRLQYARFHLHPHSSKSSPFAPLFTENLTALCLILETCPGKHRRNLDPDTEEEEEADLQEDTDRPEIAYRTCSKTSRELFAINIGQLVQLRTLQLSFGTAWRSEHRFREQIRLNDNFLRCLELLVNLEDFTLEHPASLGFCEDTLIHVTGCWSKMRFLRFRWTPQYWQTHDSSYPNISLLPTLLKNMPHLKLLCTSFSGSVPDNSSTSESSGLRSRLEILDIGSQSYSLHVSDEEIGRKLANWLFKIVPEATIFWDIPRETPARTPTPIWRGFQLSPSGAQLCVKAGRHDERRYGKY